MPNQDFENPLDPNIPLSEGSERRRSEIREWLKRRGRELGLVKDAPSLSPDKGDKK